MYASRGHISLFVPDQSGPFGTRKLSSASCMLKCNDGCVVSNNYSEFVVFRTIASSVESRLRGQCPFLVATAREMAGIHSIQFYRGGCLTNRIIAATDFEWSGHFP